MRSHFLSVSLSLVTAILLCAVPVHAQAPAPVNSIADTPAATLLLPYFQVNLNDTSGWDTIFSINNASATSVLAHVTVYSDLSVPVLNFNVYLTGYDVQVIDMRNVLAGQIPQTASAGQDPTDTISPKGTYSQDINFASCTGTLPSSLPPPVRPASTVTHLQNSLTGNMSALLGGCAGVAYGDGQARGFITIDTVNNCTTRNPSVTGYFGAGGTGDATNQNVLWGDFYFLNSRYNLSRGGELVHIHANATDPLTSTSGNYTFYGRYVGWTAIDNRQPLATTFATRFINGGLFPDGTSLIAWRDPKVAQGAFPCPASAGNPAWYPMTQEGLVDFDEQEHPEIQPTPPVYPPPPPPNVLPFGAATQRVKVGSTLLPVSYNFGWLFLNLNRNGGSGNPPIDPAADQAFVTTVFDNLGKYTAGFRAIQLDSATNANHYTP